MKEQFENQKYINVETYRKNGTPVRTPVWFLAENEIYYVRTIAESGKIKRIRKNPVAHIAPCKVDGTPVGEWVSGRARMVDDVEANRINILLRKKYGLTKVLFDLMGLFRGAQWAVFWVQLGEAVQTAV